MTLVFSFYFRTRQNANTDVSVSKIVTGDTHQDQTPFYLQIILMYVLAKFTYI